MLSLFLCTAIGALIGVLLGWLITIGTRRRLKHTVRFFQALAMQIPAGLFYQDLSQKKNTFVSHNLALLFKLKEHVEWNQILAKFDSEEKQTLNQSYQNLIKNGVPFSLFMFCAQNACHFLISGSIVHAPHNHGVLMTFQDVSELAQKLKLSSTMEHHKNVLSSALDVLNFPIFIRDSKGMTFFANQTVSHEKNDILNELNWLSLPFKAEGDFYTLTYGQETKTEDELQHILADMLTAQRRLCERLSCAVCLFNASGQLLACSAAFADLWHLNKKWLQTEPSYEDYWDAVQDNGLLTRVADFADYKRQQRENFARLSEVSEIFLYLPEGKIVRRVLIPYVQGCVILLDEIQENTKNNF